jgi:hypothetical protein
MAQLTGKFLADIFEQEIPAGDVDGVNDEFILSKTPISNKSVIVYLNGIIQAQTAHYTISGSTINFITPPSLGQVPYVFYLYR